MKPQYVSGSLFFVKYVCTAAAFTADVVGAAASTTSAAAAAPTYGNGSSLFPYLV